MTDESKAGNGHGLVGLFSALFHQLTTKKNKNSGLKNCVGCNLYCVNE